MIYHSQTNTKSLISGVENFDLRWYTDNKRYVKHFNTNINRINSRFIKRGSQTVASQRHLLYLHDVSAMSINHKTNQNMLTRTRPWFLILRFLSWRCFGLEFSGKVVWGQFWLEVSWELVWRCFWLGVSWKLVWGRLWLEFSWKLVWIRTLWKGFTKKLKITNDNQSHKHLKIIVYDSYWEGIRHYHYIP